jgi:dihydroorotase
VAKTLLDREFIRGAALSGYGQFFFGSDSAAHSLEAKLNGAAGVYTDPILIEKMVEFFSKKGKLHKIEKFMSINGRKFYGLPIPDKKITLIKEEYEYATEFNGIKIIDLKNKKLQWRRIV